VELTSFFVASLSTDLSKLSSVVLHTSFPPRLPLVHLIHPHVHRARPSFTAFRGPLYKASHDMLSTYVTIPWLHPPASKSVQFRFSFNSCVLSLQLRVAVKFPGSRLAPFPSWKQPHFFCFESAFPLHFFVCPSRYGLFETGRQGTSPLNVELITEEFPSTSRPFPRSTLVNSSS